MFTVIEILMFVAAVTSCIAVGFLFSDKDRKKITLNSKTTRKLF